MRVPISHLFSRQCWRTAYSHFSHREFLLQRFLEETHYPDTDYSFSHIDNFVPLWRYYSISSRWLARDDLFHPSYPELFIPLVNLFNARDWGGWDIGSPLATLRRGILFRGSALDKINKEDKEYLLHKLKIGAELDLRGTHDKSYVRSPLVGDVKYRNIRLHPYLYGIQHHSTDYRAAFRFLLHAISEGHNVYVHCAGGADRTGCLLFLIGAALGISESNLCKDYELSSFSSYGIRKRCYTANNSDFPFCEMVQFLKKNYPGNFREQARGWWAASNAQEPGITDDEWEHFSQLVFSRNEA